MGVTAGIVADAEEPAARADDVQLTAAGRSMRRKKRVLVKIIGE